MSKEDCVCEEIIRNVVYRLCKEFYQPLISYDEIAELTVIIFSANTDDLEDRVYEITKRLLKEKKEG